MGSKLKPGNFDCYENALPDEPMFILLARDPWAPDLVEEWARRRAADIGLGVRPMSDMTKVDEAQACATAMREWRAANDGAWRKSAAPESRKNSRTDADDHAKFLAELVNWPRD